MEKLMQAVWRRRLFDTRGLQTVDGRPVSIINQGQLNTSAGPDFSNASIRIGDETWVGNVEIHVKASDWFVHGHDRDEAYDSIILHVVDVDDTRIYRRNGLEIPQLRLPCTPDLAMRVNSMSAAAAIGLPCAPFLPTLEKIYVTDWFTALATERLNDKARRVREILDAHQGDWEETAYITLARALGMGVNAEPFERVAKSLPLQFVRKHTDDRFAVEALFFGQAGLLPTEYGDDPYVKYICDEYAFLANKFGLKAPGFVGWKFSGVRPVSFPGRRIAYLVSFILGGQSIMSRLLGVKDLYEAQQMFEIPLTGFWLTHYTFTRNSADTMSRSRAVAPNHLIINVLAPILYAYGIYIGDYLLTEFAAELLYQLPKESNSIVKMFENNGLTIGNAFDSQAVIQLRRNYCEKSKCIFCRIGHRCLSKQALRLEGGV